jgi:ankyrin repeat protein
MALAQRIPIPVAKSVTMPSNLSLECIRRGFDLGMRLDPVVVKSLMDRPDIGPDEVSLIISNWKDPPSTAIQDILSYAIRNQKLECVEFLLSNGADANGTDHDGFTPMYRVVNCQRDKDGLILAAVARAGGNVNHPTSQGKLPLISAAKHANFALARRLIREFGADYAQTEAGGLSIFSVNGFVSYACQTPEGERPLLQLVPRDALNRAGPTDLPFLMFILDLDHRPPLSQILNGRDDWDLLVQHPLSRKSFILLLSEYYPEADITAATAFVREKQPDLAPLMLPVLASGLQLGASEDPILEHLQFCRSQNASFDINSREHSPLNRTALHHAASAGELELVSALLEGGAGASILDSEGSSPLILLSRLNLSPKWQRSTHIVERLIAVSKEGRVLDAADSFGNQAIVCAAAKKNVFLVELLLRAGARWFPVGQSSQILLSVGSAEIGAVYALMEIIQRIPECASKLSDALDHRDSRGMTCLEHACQLGQVDLVKLLLQYGAVLASVEVRLSDQFGLSFRNLS